MSYRILILGASYGSLLGTKLLAAGHDVTLVCRAQTAALINAEGTEVRIKLRDEDEHRTIRSRDLPGKLDAVTPADAQPGAYDLVCLAMQEPQYSMPAVADLLRRTAEARVPCMSIMNMPPEPYMKRLPSLGATDMDPAFHDPGIWDAFEPGLVTLCSPDPQAFRPPDEAANVLHVGLPTNFKVSTFDDPAHNVMLRELEAGIDAYQIDGNDVPVKLRVFESLYVPFAKWAMLATGNYRAIQRDGVRSIRDAVQGEVTFRNDQLDDMVLLRSDGTPTYMHAVVVDDHDMGVTHIIRGDDHLTNAARQAQVYDALGWKRPVFAHIPLIHGADGKKLSKRHGAVGLHEYAALGYPAAAMRNYLARLGWAHGDDELFSDAQARAWFDLDQIGRAPARLDFKKLEHVSAHHISKMDDDALLNELDAYRTANHEQRLTQTQIARLRPALSVLKEKARTLPGLLEQAHFALIDRPVQIDEKALAELDPLARTMLKELTAALQHDSWTRDELERSAKSIAESHGLGLGKIAAPLRAALAGKTSTPSVFDMLLALGPNEARARLEDQAG